MFEDEMDLGREKIESKRREQCRKPWHNAKCIET
jgi:hypothetical protein